VRFWLAALVLLGPVVLAAQPKGDPKQGKELYSERCVLCHGSQGQGWDWTKKADPPVPVPDLAQAARQRSDQFLFDIIKDGGEAVGKTSFMPGFGFELRDSDVWAIVAYLRTLNGSGK
jgi:cytochrome c oxidase cbb3-type subunit III